MKVVDIERVVILMRFIQYGWDEERKKSFDDNLRMMLETQCEDLEELKQQIRAEVIEEVMKKAETIQLEQIENFNKSTRRNGKMWARYMSTYLGHIQVACKRMLELKENK